MARELDHALLKRTEGLLGAIDQAVSAVSTAQAVDRVLESACSAIGMPRYDSVEDWEAWQTGFPTRGATDSTWCDCHARGEDCFDAYLTKSEPIRWISAPYQQHHGHAAPYACGAEGCDCVEVLGMARPAPGPPAAGRSDQRSGHALDDLR